MITYAQLARISRHAKPEILQGILDNIEVMKEFGITPGPRLNMFLAQLAHESDGFKTTREYASGAAYEGRADLGNTQEGDGRRFRGRGLIQLTGRANYTRFGAILHQDLLTDPSVVEKFPLALTVSVAFWSLKGLNTMADKGDFQRITRRINGGLNGYADRRRYLGTIEALMEEEDV